jgi:hypothetical protein
MCRRVQEISQILSLSPRLQKKGLSWCGAAPDIHYWRKLGGRERFYTNNEGLSTCRREVFPPFYALWACLLSEQPQDDAPQLEIPIIL